MTKLYEIKKVPVSFKAMCIKTSKDAADFSRQFYSDDISIYESFFIILLNRANKTIGYAKVSQGGLVGTVVDKRIVAKYAIESLAVGVILVHNHPSGNITPSNADIEITKDIKKGLKLFDIQVIDHIILTEESYASILTAKLL